MEQEKLTTEKITTGYLEKEEQLVCLFCGADFNKEEIFEIDEHFFNAKYAITNHLAKKHGGVLKAILNLSSEMTGISETQKNLMLLLSLDLKDQEIAEQLEISPSTVRNHRFKLKEKKQQALHFVAAMELLEKNNKKLRKEEIAIYNYDSRFDINEQEREKVLANFLDEAGQVITIPRKAKSKIILLEYIVSSFDNEKIYSEKEVNQLIQKVCDDFAAIRRYLIEYGFLGRTNDGSKYWRI
ncbi:hypothetical protein M2139_001992 [Enterococcus sp. PF1-24]|uniref:DUF2087 domain-containing protein n=1 Tax=unclassified Enterococcus TaxID=2608891 RepID=UPI002477009A|nr:MULTISPECIES: DUF2087 domain-containing protein [unclassified Enterococcus]MDH6364991.1 hypothetical protein [Enterococcus sp. PFB1-1]MDH6402092.1 hypothetical protein [Enterococcus sp. PF1-24]